MNDSMEVSVASDDKPKMQVTLNIDPSQFNELVTKGLKSLSDEDFKSVLKECLIECIKKCINSNCSHTLISNRTYGYSSNGYELNSLGMRLIEQIDVSNQLTELKNKIMDDLVEHHKELVESAILSSFVRNLLDSYSFKSEMECRVQRIINELRNPPQY